MMSVACRPTLRGGSPSQSIYDQRRGTALRRSHSSRPAFVYNLETSRRFPQITCNSSQYSIANVSEVLLYV